MLQPKRSRTAAVISLFALVTFLLIVVRGARTADAYWDTLAYHWPFAARVVGLCGIDCFEMPATSENRYAGFPKVWHAIQGGLWALTGTPQFADLLTIGMVIVLCLYLRRRFAVPLVWSWLAFIAIPEVQIQLTASYIDLPLNVAITIALLVLVRLLIEPSSDSRPDIAMALLGLAIAAGSKHQLVPIAILVWTVIVVVASMRPSTVRMSRSSSVFVFLGLAGVIALLPKLIVNMATYENPFFPIAIAVGPLRFPGPEAMMQSVSISDSWVNWPSPARWLLSVFEFDAFRDRPLPWSVDQGDVSQSSPSFRMGGYFGMYVIGMLTLFVWSARRARSTSIMVLFGAATIVCASMPLSHELRYYVFWMLTLVSLVLVLVHSPSFAHEEQGSGRDVAHAFIAITAVGVVLMTGGAYVRTGGPTLEVMIEETESLAASIPEGGTLCVLNRHRRAFLYSELFHPSHHYKTRVLWADEPADCTRRVDLGP